MTRVLNLIVVVSFFLSVGCTSFTSPARQHELEEGKSYWFDYDASRRGAILIPKHEKKNVAVCSEPAPDVAKDIIDKLRADVGTGKLTVGVEANVQERVIQLAQRTQTIMFLRESMYRLCELSLNFQLKDDDVKNLYDKVIGTAVKMAEAESSNAQEANAKAQKALIDTMKETPGLIDTYKEGLKKGNN